MEVAFRDIPSPLASRTAGVAVESCYYWSILPQRFAVEYPQIGVGFAGVAFFMLNTGFTRWLRFCAAKGSNFLLQLIGERRWLTH